MNEKNHTLLELLFGIFFLGAIAQVVLYLVFEQDVYHAIGLWSGVGIAVFMAVHMYITIQKQIEMDGEDAAKYGRNVAAVRRSVMIVGLIVIAAFRLGNVLTMLVGIFTLKFAAYLQPLTNRLFRRFYKAEEVQE
ncbi:MAG: hypothetical protein UHS49_06385 [Faecalimonas sp.]|nr:hypothetical protein [Faecalimonas sp.]